MIELKNICKTYHSKKGKDTKALDNISLRFDNKGMTFILGKSGSGKSTLLNILGGLDQYDSGDMLISGKSSKNFNSVDFDSYRNTYIGFVFQEYNILEDYNIYENITLASQLQQRKVEEKEINELLEKLELEELRNRKVNELSGGQKQRVAIARALIKNPKIILADEPTGNLDSETGKQVMDLLKEISKDKLVIVVSHDTESAEEYADRMIEIKDGKILNDFRKTDEEDKLENTYQTIKSKLPLKESFKLGMGSLRHKKIKLFFTIFLTMLTLLFLSLTDTLSSYDNDKAHAKLLKEQNEEFIQIEKYYFPYARDNDYYNHEQLEITEEDSKEILSKLNRDSYEIYRLRGENNLAMKLENIMHLNVEGNMLYSPIETYFNVDIVVTEDISKILKENIIGRQPVNSDEIVISNYIADLMIENGIETYEPQKNNEFMIEEKFKPNSYQELLEGNKTYYFGEQGRVKIVGIIDYDLSKYESLKGKKYDWQETTKEEMNLYGDLRTNINNIYNKIYVNKDFLSHLKVAEISGLKDEYRYRVFYNDSIEVKNDMHIIYPAILTKEIEYYDGTTWRKTSTLAKDEMILNIKQLKNFNYQEYEKSLEKYLNNYPDADEDVLRKKFFENYVKDYQVIGNLATLKISSYRDDEFSDCYENIKIIGLTYDENHHYFSKELVSDYIINPISKEGYLVPATEEKNFYQILKDFPYNEELTAKSSYREEVVDLVRTSQILGKIAFYVSVVLFVFTVFLIGNFVVSSINYRKKEIGVLRALGARCSDVIKIFIWEGLVLAFISGTVASILLVVVTNLLNKMLETYSLLNPFIVGMRQFIVIYLIVIIVTFISSILPIRKMSKMKPIDAILKK